MRDSLARLREGRAHWALAAVAGLLTWAYVLSVPGPGLDPSWIAALHMAARDGMNFGSELNFVYGPLGFLTYPHMFYSGTAVLAVLATGTVFFGSLGLIARSMLRAFPPVAAVILTLLLAGVTTALFLPERLEGVYGLLCLAFVLDERPLLTPRRAGLMGALAAGTALVKFSSGAVVLTLLAILLAVGVLAAEDRRAALRAAAVGVAAYLVGFAVLWLVARQSLGDIPDYVSQGRDMIRGNSDAVSLEEDGRGWEYWAAALGVALLALALFYAVRPLGWTRRAGAVALAALLAWITFRHGFTRHDGHSFLFFATLLFLTPLLAERGRPLVAVAAGVVLSVGALSQHPAWDALRFSTNTFVDTAWTLTSTDKRVKAREESRRLLSGIYALSPRLLEAARGHTVHVDPWEAELAWVHQDIDWQPVPLIQPYTAYTEKLDELNAGSLASEGGPDMILREQAAVDRRNPRWESPDYMVAMLCHYRERASEGRWQLLEWGPSRCGSPASLGSRRAGYGEAVDVPAGGPDDIVVARFTDIDESFGTGIRRMLFKRHELYAGVGEARVFRLIQGHAGNRHLMRVPECLGWNSAQLDYAPYPIVGLGHGDGTLATLAPGSKLGAGVGSYTVSFQRIPFSCPAPVTRSPAGRGGPRLGASPAAPARSGRGERGLP